MRALTRALVERDADALLAVMHPDVEFEPLSTQVAEREPFRGHDAMRAYLAALDRDWDVFDISISETRLADPYVVSLGRVYARSGGVVADDPIAFVWELRDGVVVAGRTFSDRVAALRFAAAVR